MKVYVIGAGYSKQDFLTSNPKLPEGTEIVMVNSKEDIPIEDRLSSGVAITEIFKITEPFKIGYENGYYDKKRKGHERPYKFHK